MSRVQPKMPSMSYSWWMKRPNYIRYMARELTCVWIGAYAIALVIGLFRLQQGADEWQAWLAAMASTPGLVFQVLALVFALYHTISWFHLAPSTMPVWRGDQQVPPIIIEVVHYLVWIGISIVVFWLAGG